MLAELKKRIITGGVAGLLFLALLSHPTGFTVVMLFIAILALYELYALLQKVNAPLIWVAPVLLSNIWALTRALSYSWRPEEGLLSIPVFAGFTAGLYVLSAGVAWRKHRWNSPSAMALASIAWPGWSIALMIMIIAPDHMRQFYFFLGLLLLIWASDIAQYFFGRRWGKRPLAPSISPKKTLEGWLGGGVGILLISTANSLWVAPQYSIFQWGVIGGIVWVFGTAGDLYESVFKRSAGVKDSGTILPGHGGILDRFDSLIFAFPFVVLWIFIMKW